MFSTINHTKYIINNKCYNFNHFKNLLKNKKFNKTIKDDVNAIV